MRYKLKIIEWCFGIGFRYHWNDIKGLLMLYICGWLSNRHKSLCVSKATIVSFHLTWHRLETNLTKSPLITPFHINPNVINQHDNNGQCSNPLLFTSNCSRLVSAASTDVFPTLNHIAKKIYFHFLIFIFWVVVCLFRIHVALVAPHHHIIF